MFQILLLYTQEDSDDDESQDESDDRESDYPDVEEISERNNDKDDDDNDDDNDKSKYDDDDDDDDDEKVGHGHRHEKRKIHQHSQEEEKDDDEHDDEDAVSKHDVPRIHGASIPNDKDNDDDKNATHKDNDYSDSKKKDMASVAKFNDKWFHGGMVSGMGSEISFVSKHGPAKFYWVKPGTKGSKKSSQL